MDFKPLRDHILQLAISGQLVPQLYGEPDVEQLGSAPAPEDVPFAIPEKWKWVQLACLGDTFTGKTPPTSNQAYFGQDIPFITPGDIDTKGHVTYTNRGITWLAKDVVKTVPVGTVFMVCIGSIGKCGLAAQEIAFNQQINAIVPDQVLVDSTYLLRALTSPCFQSQIKRKSKATVVPIVNKTEWGSLLVPLPSLAEQHRIAAMVDDLFGRLDQMEAAYSDFAGPMTEHFRNTALQMAISGQLVPQLDSEPEVQQIGPAPEKVPFAIPEKWKWVELGKLLPFGRSKQVKPEQIPANSWLLGLEEIESNGGLIRKCYDWESINSSKSAFKAGNVLYSKMRPYLNKVIIADEDGFCSTELLVLDVNQAHLPLHAGFMLYFLRAPYFVSLATKHSQGQKPRLDLKEGKKFLVPVPPLAEQCRIVAKLEELFSGVDKLGSLVAFT